MLDMEIRLATQADFAELIRVQREVQALHRQLHPKYYRDPTDDELLQAVRESFAAENSKLWIAVGPNGVAGYLLLKIQLVPENAYCPGRKEAVVDQIGVLAAHQRQGVGRALTEEALSYATNHGCNELRLTMMANNAAARQFYKAIGFDIVSHRLMKRL